jgi:glutamate synthase domain-containing protein 2/glutamate synthase domain-containing protein 1/formylmethanofuran dehydrogenase subunit C
VGFVADIKGVRSHTIVAQAMEALTNLDHRGAAGKDPLSGDGVGILTQVPHLFFRKKLAARGISLARDTDLAVGFFFLPGVGAPGGSAAAEQMVELVERTCAENGLAALLWRKVPVGEYALGKLAADSLPDIRQLLLRRPAHLTAPGAANDAAFERLLYLTRKQLEKRLAAVNDGKSPFYIPSLSHKTICYKGLVIAPNLRRLYPDLNDSDFHSAIGLFHQRYSTNTFPMWYTAQPFRMLAHNGEINTLQGNLNWMRMREETMSSPLFGAHFPDLLPVVQEGGSDSAALDNVLELLVQCGRSPLQAMAMLVPEAYENNGVMDSRLRSFFEYQRTLMEPWDGPAALCFTDGAVAAAAMDRNGLRPLRYWVTESGKVIAASEVGVVAVPSERILERGKLGPGDMLAVDTARGVVLRNKEIKEELAAHRPYKAWLERSINHVSAGRSGLGQVMSFNTLREVMQPLEAQHGVAEAPLTPAMQERVDARVRAKKAFGYFKEDEEMVLKPMIDTAHEPIGSMGDDTPIAAFSAKPQLMYRYFKQRFAEVTNPPIDPLLERHAMSASITFGRKGSLLREEQHASFLVRLPSPIVTEAQLNWLLTHKEFLSRTVPALWSASAGPGGLKGAVQALCARVEAAVDSGVSYILLSDRGVSATQAPIPMLLAVGAVHHHLIRVGKRMKASILVETGEAREDHHCASLLAFGASLVHPYLAFETVAELAAGAQLEGSTTAPTVESALASYRTALNDGLLRILSKMGVSTLDSYRGSQTLEIIGLADEVVDMCFTGTTHRLPCVTFDVLGADVLKLHEAAYGSAVEYKRGSALPRSGTYAYVKNGEFHSYNPLVFNKLRSAAQSPDYAAYEKFAAEVDLRPLTNLRDALSYVKAAKPVPLEEVESAESIVRRFSTQAMSHGSVSREAHEALAIAANRIGARSNTGEGGEDPVRYQPGGAYAADRPDLSLSEFWHPKKGDNPNSRIKQVASARFGVTPEYLINAEQLEIKMAQGSKPGEGGHIPGHKVNAEVARNRYAKQGITLISPPPHHDIYSIEDLAQLIYDLKRVNAQAQVIVKLVSTTGVGTIAAGVVKAYADVVQISGMDGGTGASPLGSIKNAGINWELGLAEAQQVLVANGLRDRVVLRVDGGLKDGRDVVMGALLGAEQFGFGTAALVALGCVMARKCHLNTCPVGIATQDPELRKKFKGQPEHVVTFLIHTAEQVRRALAEMGVRSIDEIVGRTDLLALKEGTLFPKGPMDLSALLTNADPTNALPRKSKHQGVRNDPDAARAFVQEGVDLDDVVWATCRGFVDRVAAEVKAGKALPPVPGVGEASTASSMELHFPISNAARSVGARLSGEIARRLGNAGVPGEGRIQLTFHGVAGQSFGAFNSKGVKLVLRGDAHDYVGKSMHGGTIVLAFQSLVTPSPLAAGTAARAKGATENVICGNTCLYGATGGRFFAAGRGGERFAVRNSGAMAVVEGVGDNGCEYMTNGTVVVLGSVGRTFAAGMSGGRAFVFDPDDSFLDRYNSVRAARPPRPLAVRVPFPNLSPTHPIQKRRAWWTSAAWTREPAVSRTCARC